MNTTARTGLLALALTAPLAHAQQYDATIDAGASSAVIDAATDLFTSGVLIGDYHETDNPAGTQTRPGIFGGSGNQPIDASATLSTQTQLSTIPSGALMFEADLGAGTIEISGLSMDLLSGQPGATDLSVSFSFDTFRTIAPSFLYPGGVPITLPLGQLGQISTALLTQTDASSGALSPTDEPDVYDVSIVIPAALDLMVTVSPPGGDPIGAPIEALPVALPAGGQLRLLGDGEAELRFGASPDPIDAALPIEGVALPQIPFELPTLSEETAGVLFTLTPEEVVLSATLGLSITARGASAPDCPADLTGDGELNFFDVSALLVAYNTGDDAADLNGDGELNFFDISAFLSAYAAGCP